MAGGKGSSQVPDSRVDEVWTLPFDRDWATLGDQKISFWGPGKKKYMDEGGCVWIKMDVFSIFFVDFHAILFF